MADISDVENALVALAASFLQLGTSYAPGAAVASPVVGGVQCKVYRGWPVSQVLNSDLAAGIANVSVFPTAGTRYRTRYLFQWRRSTTVTPTLTASVDENVVTFGGTGGIGQVAGIQIAAQPPGTITFTSPSPFSSDFASDFGFGPPVTTVSSGNAVQTYAYRLQAQDTPSTVAAAFAGQIPGASVDGAMLTLPGGAIVQALVQADQPAWLETRRQEQQVWVIGWCPSPDVRDLVMSTIDAGFAGMQDQWGRQTEQFGLPDGSNGILRYLSSKTDDAPETAELWRRDLRYRVEYPTTLLELQPTVMFTGGTFTAASNPVQFGSAPAAGCLADTQGANTIAATAAAT